MFNERRAANRKQEAKEKLVQSRNATSSNNKRLNDHNNRDRSMYNNRNYQRPPKRNYSDISNEPYTNKRFSNNHISQNGNRYTHNNNNNYKDKQHSYNSYNHNNEGRSNRDGRYEKIKAVPLESLKLPDSKWDKAPEKLKGLSARFAKSVGIFSSPNYNSLDTLSNENILKLIEQQKKLMQLKKDKLSQQRLLSINDSKISKRVILKGIDFEKNAPQSIHNFFESFLASIVIPNVSYEDLNLTTNVDGDSLIVDCASSLIATTIMSFNSKYISELDTTFEIERPGDYVEYVKSFKENETNETNDESNNKNNETAEEIEDKEDGIKDIDIVEEIIETSTLCCVNNIPKEIDNLKFRKILQKYGNLHSAVLLLDKISYENCDTAFFSFNEDQKSTQKILNEISKNEKWNCFLVCKNKKNNYYQSVDLTRNNLDEYIDSITFDISAHKITSTIQILNVISLDDLMDNEKAKKVSDIFEQELGQMNGFEKLVLIKPPNDFKIYQVDEIQPEFGRIFVKFKSPKDAKLCLENLCGRYFHNRILLGSYVDDTDSNIFFKN